MYHLHHVCISLVLVLKRCMVCMTACEYMACMLLSPCCQDDYFLCSVILPVPSIPCLDSSNQLCLTLVFTFCRDPGLAYASLATTQSYGEPRTVPTCLSRQGQAQNVLGEHRTRGASHSGRMIN